MCNFVILYTVQEIGVNKLFHDICWHETFGGHQVDIELAVRMVERQETYPTFVGKLASREIDRGPSHGHSLNDVGEEIVVADADAFGKTWT